MSETIKRGLKTGLEYSNTTHRAKTKVDYCGFKLF